MKKLLLGLVVAFGLLATCFAEDVYVNGYTRKDGTYVAPYHRSAPDGTVNNNFSTRGNVNPYTGEAGTKPRSDSYSPLPSYNSGSSLLNPKPVKTRSLFDNE